ncbi:MAG: DHHA1 domain-containing protein, partial [Candidatus Ratteibacteria bacterium]|nr:DHHA1 domain-containing protein [Candidatus Ratteibacteria bacterium]
FKELAGVGVVFKFAQVLQEGKGLNLAEEHLDLVALGTISDVVPLTDENRILVKHGLGNLGSSQRKGINALKKTARINGKDVTARDVAFILGPRLNAGGRMDTADKCVRMLLSDSEEEALSIACLLEEDNKQRQKLQEEIFQQAVYMMQEDPKLSNDRILVLANEGWHPGVVGIVSSRLAEKFERPSILISLDNGVGRGSGRSSGDFNLFENLAKARQWLKDFGGHKHACGLEILKDNIVPFRESINKLAPELPAEEFASSLTADASVSLDILTNSVVKEFQLFSPFGLGNEEPVFITRNLQVMTEPKKVGSNHIKFWVKDKNFHREVIGFGKSDFIGTFEKNDLVDLAYSAQIDEWENRDAIILKMEDIHPVRDLI